MARVVTRHQHPADHSVNFDDASVCEGDAWNDLSQTPFPCSRSEGRDVSRGMSVMKRMLFGAALAVAALTVTGSAEAKGCIKGAIVGGIAGHYAGHHALVGAAAGCAIGRHRANAQARPADQGARPVSAR